MIVCICKQVSEKEIQKCVSNGLNFDEIQFELGICLQCGCCETYARKLIDSSTNKDLT